MAGKSSAKPTRRRLGPWIAAAAVAVALVGGGLYYLSPSASALVWHVRTALTDRPRSSNHLTLDPALFAGQARDAYEVAERHPELLAQLHCYCGCDRYLGHQTLLDCYRTDHGAHCPICVGEAVDGERLYNQGVPIEQIRTVLRERYKRGE